jgi:hypothetical protein
VRPPLSGRCPPLPCALTLPADTYFAIPDPLDLHLYICIAILTNCKDALEELDQSEAKSMLFSLPPLDVDRVSGVAGGTARCIAHRRSLDDRSSTRQ